MEGKFVPTILNGRLGVTAADVFEGRLFAESSVLFMGLPGRVKPSGCLLSEAPAFIDKISVAVLSSHRGSCSLAHSEPAGAACPAEQIRAGAVGAERVR